MRVLALNLYYGKAEPRATSELIRAADPEVLVLPEISDTFLDGDQVADALAAYPHRVGRSVPGYAKVGYEDPRGTLVFSKFPLTQLEQLPSVNDQYVVRVDAPGAPFTLIAAHPTNMVSSTAAWEHEGRLLQTAIGRHQDGPLVVAGDLNATPEQLPLRRVLDESGVSLAADEAGAGWVPTFNGGISALPPVITIDHVLVNDRVTATGFHVVDATRTDHEAIVADLVVG